MKIHEYNEMMAYLLRPKPRQMLANGSVEEFVEIVKKMVADPEYMSPININAKEVGRIPNF